jgi:hypothetical protein
VNGATNRTALGPAWNALPGIKFFYCTVTDVTRPQGYRTHDIVS